VGRSPEELRPATSLARVWAKRGRAGEARALLANVHDWFTAGFDTPDLRETRSLLDDLGRRPARRARPA
jgi:predicted ATPase